MAIAPQGVQNPAYRPGGNVTAGAEVKPSRRPPILRGHRETLHRACAFLNQNPRKRKETTMLGWALTFLVIALIAAALGFGGVAGAATSIAQIIFYIFLVLLLVSLVMHFVRGTAP
jgi:uncharacterized membrane protein YtjA (UPF0391 family)